MNLTLGELIHHLEQLPSDMPVRFDFADGEIPGEFCSWRGSYDQLSLEPVAGVDVRLNHSTVGPLLVSALIANGATFDGYKGGEFTMRWSTPLWADPWGTCAGRAITGFMVRKTTLGDTAILLTAMVDIWNQPSSERLP